MDSKVLAKTFSLHPHKYSSDLLIIQLSGLDLDFIVLDMTL